MHLLLLDNYDSFTWNLHDLLVQAGWAEGLALTLDVVRNDHKTVPELLDAQYSGVVISPGPNAPDQAGVCMPLIRAVLGKVPIFGVCLGHQAIAQVLGGHIVRASAPVHGKVAPIAHAGTGCMRGLPSPFTAMRYHSLVVNTAALDGHAEVHAWLADDPAVVMGLHAPGLLAEGVQFHPESVGTPLGLPLARNVVRWCASQGSLDATRAT